MSYYGRFTEGEFLPVARGVSNSGGYPGFRPVQPVWRVLPDSLEDFLTARCCDAFRHGRFGQSALTLRKLPDLPQQLFSKPPLGRVAADRFPCYTPASTLSTYQKGSAMPRAPVSLDYLTTLTATLVVPVLPYRSDSQTFSPTPSQLSAPALISDELYVCDPAPPEPFSAASAAHVAAIQSVTALRRSRIGRRCHSLLRFRQWCALNEGFSATILHAYLVAYRVDIETTRVRDMCTGILPDPEPQGLLWHAMLGPAYQLPDLLQDLGYTVNLRRKSAPPLHNESPPPSPDTALLGMRTSADGGIVTVVQLATPIVVHHVSHPVWFVRLERRGAQARVSYHSLEGDAWGDTNAEWVTLDALRSNIAINALKRGLESTNGCGWLWG